MPSLVDRVLRPLPAPRIERHVRRHVYDADDGRPQGGLPLDQFRNGYNTARPHRAIGRRTPAQAYAALPRATPDTPAQPEWRTRVDTVD